MAIRQEIREAGQSIREVVRTVRRARSDGKIDHNEALAIREALAFAVEEVGEVVGWTKEAVREVADLLRRLGVSGAP